MPLHVADMTVKALAAAGREVTGADVAVLGYAYLEESEDTRNSPSEALVAQLRGLGVAVRVHDPWVADYMGDVFERAAGCDAAIVMVAHRAYRGLDLAALRAVLRTPILIDGRHVIAAEQARAAGLNYYGLGQG
jgi:UDP-N-acetyl-D-mannosaminuronic acid dehydrogenase